MKKRMIIMLLTVTIILTIVFGFQIIKGIFIKKYFSSMSTTPITVSSIQVVKENWSSEIEKEVKRLREIEPNKDTKENIERLLNGEELK